MAVPAEYTSANFSGHFTLVCLSVDDAFEDIH